MTRDPWFVSLNPDMAVTRRENIAVEKLVVKELARLDHGCLYFLPCVVSMIYQGRCPRAT
jgi:hypothetical protein